MNRGLFLVLTVVGLIVAGCGDKTEPPLTTNELASDAKMTEGIATQTGGNVPSRPQGNPNAPYKPSR